MYIVTSSQTETTLAGSPAEHEFRQQSSGSDFWNCDTKIWSFCAILKEKRSAPSKRGQRQRTSQWLQRWILKPQRNKQENMTHFQLWKLHWREQKEISNIVRKKHRVEIKRWDYLKSRKLSPLNKDKSQRRRKGVP